MKNRMLILALLLCLGSAVAFAAPIVYVADLSGPAEFPPNASPGTGFAMVIFDDVANTMRVIASFSGLTGTTTAAHIHCCVSPSAAVPTAGVATQLPSFTGFPLGVTSGGMDQTFDLTLASSFSNAFITNNGGTVAGAEAALAAGLAGGMAYFNVHTSTFGGGEIRGFLDEVPEPSTYSLMAGALIVLGLLSRKRSRY